MHSVTKETRGRLNLKNHTSIAMKRNYLLLALLITPVLVQAQSWSVKRELRRADPGREVTRIMVPGCVMKFASLFVDEPETRKMLRKMKGVYVWTTEGASYAAETNVPSTIAQKGKQRGFEELMSVKSDRDDVNILMRQRGRNYEYLFTVNGDEDVVVYLKSRLSLSDLAKHGDYNIGGVKLNSISQTL